MSADGLTITVSARADNVAIVRHAVAGLAEAVGMDAPMCADLKTVVTEACMNVVVHAYEGEPGPLEVSAHRDGAELVVTVRDFGSGIRPRANSEHPSLRLGLPLIAALASSFGISGGLGQGTEVTMRVGLSSIDAEQERPTESVPAADGTEVSLPAGELVGPVLSRVISMFAARADFSVDRLSDAVLLGDAISAHGPAEFADGNARLRIDMEEGGGIGVRVGPLTDGAGERMLGDLQIPGLDASLAGLADEVRVEDGLHGEELILRIGRPD